MRRHILSKWAKTQALLPYASIRRYIPKTMVMNKENVFQMLQEYSMVYIKPDIGTFGKGVMKVEHKSLHHKDGFRYQLGVKKETFEHFDVMYDSILRKTQNQTYIVQKGIHLSKYLGLPYDLRVMVQKSPSHEWETTGIIGRVAHPRKIVTNFHSGGTLVPMERLLSHRLLPDRKHVFVQRIDKLGEQIATTLSKKYPGIREIGIDLGIDRKLKPWIIEINTLPDPYIFKKLNHKAIYAKIIRYNRLNKR